MATVTHLPTLEEIKALRESGEPEYYEGNPFADADPDKVKDAYAAIMERHLLAVLRKDANKTLAQVAEARGVTLDAARQTENRDLAAMKLGSLIEQIQAIGYDVDLAWAITALADNLPTRTNT